ncbi:hypothetical protein B0H11DRAFT_2229582 [Mycena galericulata]|nr:hypothetical protein B0H11DRAFT_2229582 [Mycena galericulata]
MEPAASRAIPDAFFTSNKPRKRKRSTPAPRASPPRNSCARMARCGRSKWAFWGWSIGEPLRTTPSVRALVSGISHRRLGLPRPGSLSTRASSAFLSHTSLTPPASGITNRDLNSQASRVRGTPRVLVPVLLEGGDGAVKARDEAFDVDGVAWARLVRESHRCSRSRSRPHAAKAESASDVTCAAGGSKECQCRPRGSAREDKHADLGASVTEMHNGGRDHRRLPQSVSAHSKGFLMACAQVGIPLVPDFNGSKGTMGAGSVSDSTLSLSGTDCLWPSLGLRFLSHAELPQGFHPAVSLRVGFLPKKSRIFLISVSRPSHADAYLCCIPCAQMFITLCSVGSYMSSTRPAQGSRLDVRVGASLRVYTRIALALAHLPSPRAVAAGHSFDIDVDAGNTTPPLASRSVDHPPRHRLRWIRLSLSRHPRTRLAYAWRALLISSRLRCGVGADSGPTNADDDVDVDAGNTTRPPLRRALWAVSPAITHTIGWVDVVSANLADPAICACSVCIWLNYIMRRLATDEQQ